MENEFEKQEVLDNIARSIWRAQRIGLSPSEIEEAIIDGLDQTTHA